MKIAFFLDDPYSYGGAGTLLLKQAALMSKIHDVIIVIPTNEVWVENPRYAEYCDMVGLKHVGMAYKTAYNFRNIDLLRALKDIPELKKFLVNEKIDFIHSVQLNVAVEMASRQLDLPHLMNIYQLEKEEFLFSQCDIYAHYHLCDSEKYSLRWREEMLVDSKCLRPLSPVPTIRRKESEFKSSYNIIMLGGLYERKNQLSAIRAVEQIRDRISVNLVIVGDNETPYGKICKDYVKEHKLEGNVNFLGFVMEIEKVLLSGDWFLMASIDESFPSSVVEAISYDLLLISTPVAGIPEVFKNHVNAFISEDFSVRAIIAAIEDCYSWCKDKKINEIKKNVFETWKNNFSLDINAIKLNDYYSEIIEKNRYVKKRQWIEPEFVEEVEKMESMILEKCTNGLEIASHAFYCNYIMKRLCAEDNKKVYIWGAGKYGSMAYDFLSHCIQNIEILGFLDKYKEGSYLGYSIINPRNIIYNKDTHVFLAFAGDVWSAINSLKRKGFEFLENVWIFP